ncbi:MAG TPA: sugar phosphate nucleotidyltransferase [Candidatus Paceibacterota bacterium]
MQAVVIAAGESKRFWPLNNGIHKSQFRLLGKPLIYWTLKGLAENGIKDVMIVVSKNSTIQEMLDKENDLGIKITYAVQEEPLGTGNALWQAKDFIKESFILLWGNKIGSKDLVRQMLVKQKEGAEIVFVGTEVENPSEYGVARLVDERLVEIVENPDKGKEPSNIEITGARLLQPDFFEYYEKLSKHHEADLVDATNAYLKDKKASLLVLEEKGLTLKYPWDLFGIMDYLFVSEYFQPRIASSAQVATNVVMKGPVHIGENTVIKDGTVIEGPVYIGDNCKIGYNNVLRGPVNIEDDVHTTSFAEIKNSIIQQDVHMASGFFGNSIAASGCRFGAGFITGNRRLDRENVKVKLSGQKIETGLPRFGIAVGEKSVFGIHSGTMPGVLIGSNCKIGPATHVFENLEDSTTFYAKFDHVKKKD